MSEPSRNATAEALARMKKNLDSLIASWDTAPITGPPVSAAFRALADAQDAAESLRPLADTKKFEELLRRAALELFSLTRVTRGVSVPTTRHPGLPSAAKNPL